MHLAFVYHQIICRSFPPWSHFGVNWTELTCFEAYFIDGTRIVVINNEQSDEISVNSLGVPHASVFGPILFSICISDLTRAACCKMHLRVYHAVLLVAKPKTEDVHTNRNREINSAAKRRIANKLTDIDKKNS